METQQQINELQSRQLELRAIMASSDERAAKCFKNGTSFRETYPDDFARYEAANAEYNRNEQTLAKLKRREMRNEPRKSRRITSTPYEPANRTIDNDRNRRAELGDSDIDVDFLSSACGFDHLVGRCSCGYRLRSLFRL